MNSAGYVWISENIIGQVTEWIPSTKRPRGCPRQRSKDKMEKDLVDLGIKKWIELAKERNRWKQVVIAAMSLIGF